MRQIGNKNLTILKNDPPIKILIVDDDQNVRWGLKMFLELDPELFIVGIATNGQEAIEKVNLLKPDIVLMDLLMPILDGISATQLIKIRFPDVEIIALTSVLEDDRIYLAIQAGAMGYLTKDIQANQLSDAIKRLHYGEILLNSVVAERLMRTMRILELPDALTENEIRVLKLLARGLSNREIAARLGKIEKIIKSDVSGILTKLNLLSRTQATLYAKKVGMLDTAADNVTAI